jgi:hypothetical protein
MSRELRVALAAISVTACAAVAMEDGASLSTRRSASAMTKSSAALSWSFKLCRHFSSSRHGDQ